MKTSKEIIKTLTEAIIPQQSGPRLAKVVNTYEGIGMDETKYCIDVEFLKPGSLESTGEILAEVPIDPIWSGKTGQGIFCPPEKDSIVIIEFIELNPSFPFVSGRYGNKYRNSDFKKNQFTITDGKGAQIKISEDSLFTITNNVTSIKGLLESLINEIEGLVTTGSPATQVVSPSSIAKLEAFKQKVSLLFKE